MIAVKEMENTLGELPGLKGSTFLTDALDAAARRSARPSAWADPT